MDKNSRIYVAGHQGLVGSALLRVLAAKGYRNLITRVHQELDLTELVATRTFFDQERPEYVFLAAAKVGGILANSIYPAEFIHQNLAIQTHVINESWRTGVKRLLFLGSSCIYPRDCPQPIKEEYLLTGPLEPSNRPYAVAKIAGIEMCSAYNRQYGTQYLAVMPANLYGPGDHYDLETSHVIPALIRKFHEAKIGGDPEVIVWGSGTPRREFLYSDDLAEACVFLMNLSENDFFSLLNPSSFAAPLINIGAGEDHTIRDLTKLIQRVTGYSGKILFDRSKPDGTPRKLLDVGRLQRMGWRPSTPLKSGLPMVYRDFQRA